jgi:hypothetical protein
MPGAFLFILLLAGTVVSVSGSRAWKLASLGLARHTAGSSVRHGFTGSSPIDFARHLLSIFFLGYAIILRWQAARQAQRN